MPAASLPSFSVLFSSTIELIRTRWKPMLWVQLVGLGVLFGATVLYGLALALSVFVGGWLESPFTVGLLTVIWSVLLTASFLWLGSWLVLAQMQIIDTSETSIKALFTAVKGDIWRYLATVLILICLLLGLLILFIVPGIIFGTYWILVLPVFYKEGLWGWAALKRSKQLVSGQWRAVFVRLFLFQVIGFCFLFGISILSAGITSPILQVFASLVQSIVGMIYGVVMIAFSFVLYTNIVSSKSKT